ncbi:MAG: heparinase II/III family protein [Elusimicrobiota bacterium]
MKNKCAYLRMLVVLLLSSPAWITCTNVMGENTKVLLSQKQRPYIIVNKDKVAEIKERIQKYEWAKTIADRLIKQANNIVATPVNIPDTGGEWTHYYACRQCGRTLDYVDGKNWCPVCKLDHPGMPYDGVVVSRKHHAILDNLFNVSIVYALTSDTRYAKHVRDVLTGYAERYRNYPLHGVRSRTNDKSWGHVFSQTLDEAVTFISVVWAYDIICSNTVFSDIDKQNIEQNLFLEVAKNIMRNNSGRSNWQSWHNGLLTAVGLCLNDSKMVSDALYGDSGLQFQLNNSVLPDGFWYESSPSYHFYALKPIRETVEMASLAGITEFVDNKQYRSLFAAPLEYVQPNLRFPGVSDAAEFSLSGESANYEYAYAKFRDPNYATAIKSRGRNSMEALLYGVEPLPETAGLVLTSKNFGGLGAAVLREGTGSDQLYLHFDYGPYGSGHGHPDKLAIHLYGYGKVLAPDPGVLNYGAAQFTWWYKQTLSHNTVLINEKSQAKVDGILEFFHTEPGFHVARGMCDNLYPGVAMRRTVVLTDKYVVDIFDIDCGTVPVTIDWAYHNYGILQSSLPWIVQPEPVSKEKAYQYFTDIKKAEHNDDWTADFVDTASSVTVRLTMLGHTAGETNNVIYAGNGLAGKPPQKCPMVLARKTGATSARYIAVIEPYRTSENPPLRDVKVINNIGVGGIARIELTRSDAKKDIISFTTDKVELIK